MRIGYGVGAFGTGTFSTVPGLLLLFYLTNVLAVSAWLAGLVVFLPKLWDLFINTYVGQRSDSTVSRFGPRRPWLLLGALTLPVAFALTFLGPPLTGVPAAIYVGVMFFLTATAYAFFEVPYKAMPAEMTGDYHERSSLLQWRMIFLGLAILVSGAVAPAITSMEGIGGPVAGYRLMGVVIGALLLIAMLGAFFGTARAPVVGKVATEHSLRAQLVVARTNGMFLVVLVLSCAQMFAASVMLAGTPYFATYVLGHPETTTALFVFLVGPILLTMPLWVRLSTRLEKRGAMVLSSALFLAGAAGLALTPQFGTAYAYGCVLLVGVGYAGFQLLQFSMLSDVIVHDSLVTGKRRAGVFTGLWTASETVVMGLGALALGWILGAVGFVESDPSTPVTQPAGAVDAVLLSTTLLPALFMAISIALTLRYTLTAETLAEAGRAAEGAPAQTAS
ncbi:MFS transporter [Microtetraspora sp. NBRC 13810]|uniref:MFS transporter n=1 Tax=Microtetraspora sp. NBRC 13810 TaxID=3030990 RepID=UPI00255606F3|nr:MFS transporter [Microtetraspora sp. NBRC 13810]